MMAPGTYLTQDSMVNKYLITALNEFWCLRQCQWTEYVCVVPLPETSQPAGWNERHWKRTKNFKRYFYKDYLTNVIRHRRYTFLYSTGKLWVFRDSMPQLRASFGCCLQKKKRRSLLFLFAAQTQYHVLANKNDKAAYLSLHSLLKPWTYVATS